MENDLRLLDGGVGRCFIIVIVGIVDLERIGAGLRVESAAIDDQGAAVGFNDRVAVKGSIPQGFYLPLCIGVIPFSRSKSRKQ